jgi:hypothetical protein
VSKSDDELITKSDITELTKALGEFSKAMDGFQKSFASHFESLTTAQPQKIGGKGHSVTNTMQKDEDPDPDEDPGKRVRKDEDPDPDPGRRKVRKDEDPDEDPDPEPKRVRKALDIDTIQKAYDSKIAALEEKISKMENSVIQKGGSAVVIPEQVSKDDPVFSNLGIFDKMGKVAK